MDPIGSIKPQTDSTLLLGLEAQKRSYELFYYTPHTLSWSNGAVTARAQRITLYDGHEHYYDLQGDPETTDLKSMDVILLRQDPPFNIGYITTTYLLEKLHPKPFVVNNPRSVRDFPEKLLPLLFQQYMPPTLISADRQEIDAFRQEHQDIVLKPLYGYAGHKIFRVRINDVDFEAMLDKAFTAYPEPWIAQRFLPEVKTGDRRIILIDGEIGGIMARIPAEHEFRANFRVGGTAAKAELTAKQHEICTAMGPLLKEKGLIFAGLDIIGDWLTEVNITSPTGLPAMNRVNSTKLEVDIWDAIERYA